MPDPDQLYPIADFDQVAFAKNLVADMKNVEIGDYTYYHDFEDVRNLRHNIRYHLPYMEDKLQIGKFCMIAHGATFLLNGANHLTEAFSPYPFALFAPEWQQASNGVRRPNKGNIVIGNDVWLGYKATILPGVQIGNGAIIAANALVCKNVAPYEVVGGNPARHIKFRFDEKTIQGLEKLSWWDWDIAKINRNIAFLTDLNWQKLVE